MEKQLKDLGKKLEDIGIFKEGSGRIVKKGEVVKFEGEIDNHEAFMMFAKTVTKKFYKEPKKRIGGRIKFTGRVAINGALKWGFKVITLKSTEDKKSGALSMKQVKEDAKAVRLTFKGINKDLMAIEEELVKITGKVIPFPNKGSKDGNADRNGSDGKKNDDNKGNGSEKKETGSANENSNKNQEK